MANESSVDAGFLSSAQAFTMCGVCDTQHGAGLTECPKCKSPLSTVRKCPSCSKIVSAKHQRCIYCSTSFLADELDLSRPRPTPLPAAPAGPDPDKRRKAILVSVAVFLIVMFLGLWLTVQKGSQSQEVVASTFMVRPAALRLQPNSNSGSSATLQPPTVIQLMNLAVDSEGSRWFAVKYGESSGFVAVLDVAPPKVRLPELGSQMLRAWLIAFRDPGMVSDADNAVTYFCAQFPASPHCDELRWIAAERFRSIAQREGSQDALARSRRLLASVKEGKGPNANDAAKTLDSMDEPKAEGSRSSRSGSSKSSATKGVTLSSGREYALVDAAEVHVRVPNLKAYSNGAVVKTPIAREIRINGKVAIPSNATCIMKVGEVDAASSQLTVQLTAIEFANKHYDVATTPQRISSNGAVVVFPLESSLLIGK